MKYRLLTSVIFIATSLIVTPAFSDGVSKQRSWRIFLKSGQMIEFQAIWNGTDAGSKFTEDYKKYLKDGTKPTRPIMYNFKQSDSSGNTAAHVLVDWDRVEAVVQVF